jgi:SRSO17 transposase
VAGAARQYSGTAGGIALCQVAVTVTYATGRGHAQRQLSQAVDITARIERRQVLGGLINEYRRTA